MHRYVYVDVCVYVYIHIYVQRSHLPFRRPGLDPWVGKMPCIKQYLLYPFICQWIYRLLPHLDNHQSCCREHKGTGVFSNCSFVKNMVLY